MMLSKEKLVHLLEVTAITLTLCASLASPHQHRRRSSNQQRARHGQQHQQQGEGCSEPADLKQRLEDLYGTAAPGQVHDSFLLLPSMRDALVGPSASGLNDTSTCTKVFSGSDNCSHQDAHDASPGDPCPTYTCLNCDPNRYPKVLLESRCSCKGRCRGILKKTDKNGQAAATPTCEGAFHPVRVLRRSGCRDGVYQYITTWLQLQVGCACKLVA